MTEPSYTQLQFEFDKQVREFYPRYLSDREVHSEQVGSYALLNADSFKIWQQHADYADRKTIIYSLLDKEIGDSLMLWQVIERLNDDRRAHQVSKILEKATNEDMQEARFWNALTRNMLILCRLDDAKVMLERAEDIENDNLQSLRLKADILHLENKTEKSAKIYQQIYDATCKEDKELDAKRLLAYDGNRMNSPIFAQNWLLGRTDMPEEAWQWANDEFCYSPHFQQAYVKYLLLHNQEDAALYFSIKLGRDMPWYKDGVVLAYQLMTRGKDKPEIKSDFMAFESLIISNKWI